MTAASQFLNHAKTLVDKDNKTNMLSNDKFVPEVVPEVLSDISDYRIVAVTYDNKKVVSKSLKALSCPFPLKNEWKVMQSMPPSPYIVTYIGYTQDPLRLVFEYLPVSLTAALENATPLRRIQIAFDIARGLQHTLKNGYVHRDIKSSNILLDSIKGTAKLIDFGIALRVKKGDPEDTKDLKTERDINVSNTSDKIKYANTINYAATEIMMGTDTRLPASDVFSFGIVLLEIFLTPEEFKSKIYTALPAIFGIENHDGTRYKKIANAIEYLRAAQRCPEVILKLMSECTRKEHAERPTINNVVERLEDYLYPKPTMLTYFNCSSNFFKVAGMVAATAAIITAASSVTRNFGN
ncbi:hypothetical protein AYO45_04155 [Gammaproteobacteria bacterium SCGC AG-212-F23]|nr:hypothetical protein AYO45_04155 [Gammaproteobacteria bacterium SCGC AG-212-F23]